MKRLAIGSLTGELGAWGPSSVTARITFFAESFGLVDQIDAVTLALTHLARAIKTGNLDWCATKIKVSGLGEKVYAVERSEAACEATCEFEMLQLVFSYGHLGGLLNQNIDGHEGGICEQTGIDTFVG